VEVMGTERFFNNHHSAGRTIMDLRTIMRNSLYFGIGAISMTREKVEETVSELVKKGEMTRGEGKHFAEEVTKSVDKARKEIDKQVQMGTKKTAKALNLVTREELKKLERKITKLNSELKKLSASSGVKKKKSK
jgi:polyhydroxyalkanoate synthesis regulator phasin